MREHLVDVESNVNSSLRPLKRMGATWVWSPDAKTVIVTWPSTNVYKNAVARGRVFERLSLYPHLIVRHEVRK